MSQTGGKRKANKSLKAWVNFIKKVQREEKLSYKDAMKRAKERKDKGEKWMMGGKNDDMDMETDVPNEVVEDVNVEENSMMNGGRRRRRTMRRSRVRGRTMRRSRARGRSMRRSARRA